MIENFVNLYLLPVLIGAVIFWGLFGVVKTAMKENYNRWAVIALTVAIPLITYWAANYWSDQPAVVIHARKALVFPLIYILGPYLGAILYSMYTIFIGALAARLQPPGKEHEKIELDKEKAETWTPVIPMRSVGGFFTFLFQLPTFFVISTLSHTGLLWAFIVNIVLYGLKLFGR